MTGTLFLSSDDVEGIATIEEFVTAVREGYRQRGEGAGAEPRTAVSGDDPPGTLTSYVAILPETGAMGGYTYTVGFGGEDAWLATPLFDARTGEPLAVIDGAWMSPYKTGAAGAVGIDALAREDADSLGLFGTGLQARGQLVAAATVRDIERVRVYSPTEEHRESFAAEFDGRLDAAVTAVSNPAAAVEGVDIVVTATDASTPVFDGELLDEGTHVTAVGQFHPERRELDTTTIRRAKYVPDLRARVERDAGAYLLAREEGAIGDDHVHAELGEVIAGAAPGREADEITVFDSGGTAIETVAAGHLLYERARDAGRGTAIEFTPLSGISVGEDP